jgi:hypothetical protein
MSYRNLSRLIAAGALVTLLALPGAARADEASATEPIDFWQWINNLWQHGISAMWTESEAPEGEQGTGTAAGASERGDIGLGFDPNG